MGPVHVITCGNHVAHVAISAQAAHAWLQRQGDRVLWDDYGDGDASVFVHRADSPDVTFEVRSWVVHDDVCSVIGCPRPGNWKNQVETELGRMFVDVCREHTTELIRSHKAAE